MKRLLTFFLLVILLSTACDVTDHDGAGTSPTRPVETVTPTPVGTWQTVIEGTVYNQSGEPIVGAVITYDVLHSHFPELQEGRSNKTITGELGEFALPVIVHDTDRVMIRVEAEGYTSYEEGLVGIDLLAGKRLDVGLTLVEN